MKLKKNINYVNTSTQCDENSFNNTYYYPLIINKEPILFKSSYYISTHKQKSINYSNFLNFSTNPRLIKNPKQLKNYENDKKNKLYDDDINSVLYPYFTEKNLTKKAGLTFFGFRQKLNTEIFLRKNWRGKRKQMEHSIIPIQKLFPSNYNILHNNNLPFIKTNNKS